MALLLQQGYTKILADNKQIKIESFIKENTAINYKEIYTIIDRIVVKSDKETESRSADSIEHALYEGMGTCYIFLPDKKEIKRYSTNFEYQGKSFEEPNIHMFSFNSPLGACPLCEGYGQTIGIDEDLVIPNKNLSIYEGAIAPWKGEKMGKWLDKLIYNAEHFNFPIHKPYYKLTEGEQKLLWSGNKYFKGLNSFFTMLENDSYKIQYRVMLARYRGKTLCPACKGSRLKPEANYIKINNHSLPELVLMPIKELHQFFISLKLNDDETIIAKRLLIEINNRLQYLMDVGLSYLTLNRKSSTLSGGESQRLNLTTSLGSSLVGSLYILDEPSIGLHGRDTDRLISVLQRLNKIGNSVLVVEHDEEIIKASDEIIDLGPGAGRLGGEIVYQGNINKLSNETITKCNSITAQYLYGKKNIPVPERRRNWNQYIELTGVRENNLKNIDIQIPLHVFTCVTGVSGSGKSSLIKNVLYPGLKKIMGEYAGKTGKHANISGDYRTVTDIEFVDQNPIGRSSRSNPATYLKAYDEIRKLYASQQASKINNYKASHFSFNIDGGRCEECQGEGIIKVEMQFMADVELVCESCKGRRFKDDILEVEYEGKNIYDILELTVDEAIEFFSQKEGTTERRIINKIKPLQDVGLGYVKLGQSSSTLSGGESQRVKLAFFLSKEKTNHTMFVFDEPTTGLHFDDINKLIASFNALIARGHTILVIEHHPDVIKSSDWIIDLGPEGGNNGGYVVFTGTPENIIKEDKSYTGKYLKEKLG